MGLALEAGEALGVAGDLSRNRLDGDLAAEVEARKSEIEESLVGEGRDPATPSRIVALRAASALAAAARTSLKTPARLNGGRIAVGKILRLTGSKHLLSQDVEFVD